MRSDIRHDMRRSTRGLRFRLRRLAWLAASASVVAALAPAGATADRVYHSEHLAFTPVGGAPLQSGFVENIKAEGPTLYAHEIFVLNGAQPNTTYVVTRDFYFLDPECDGSLVFHEDVATLRTNAAGNAQGDAVVEPSDVAGFEGVHGVTWTVRTGGTVVYRTSCTAVTLD
jgi:hypothetical protein